MHYSFRDTSSFIFMDGRSWDSDTVMERDDPICIGHLNFIDRMEDFSFCFFKSLVVFNHLPKFAMFINSDISGFFDIELGSQFIDTGLEILSRFFSC